jgi:DNA topoisomerase IB
MENLYDRVVPGGIIQIDDYTYWNGCRKAIDEFLACRGIDRAKLVTISSNAAVITV